MMTETIFKAYVDLANSERQAIWARNASMLVANSFMLSAIANLHPAWLRDWFAVAGLILCVAWYFMMKRGWILQGGLMREGGKIVLGETPNPLAQMLVLDSKIDLIQWLTILVIALFGLTYLATGFSFLIGGG
jgi:hypothetical protein